MLRRPRNSLDLRALVAAFALVLAAPAAAQEAPAEVSQTDTLDTLEFTFEQIAADGFRNPAPAERDALTAWQPDARDRLRRSLGVLALPLDAFPPAVQDVARFEGEGYVRREITWVAEPGLRTRGFLFEPTTPGPHPAVLFLHGHSFGGYRAAAGVDAWTDDEHDAGATRLAEAGYVVLAPGMRTFEPGADDRDHIHFNAIARLRGATPIAFFTTDALRALDLLAAQPTVDADRLGVTGFSVGGLLALLTGGLDERVQATVVQGFLGSYAGDLMRSFHCACQFSIPLGIDYDVSDLAALVAPRTLLFVGGVNDPEMPIEEQRAAHAVITEHYQTLGAPDATALEEHPGRHEYVPDAAISLFDRVLRPSANP